MSGNKDQINWSTPEKVLKKLSTKHPKLPVLHRSIVDMSSEAYHGSVGAWSSSQLKIALEDEDLFIRKYIKKEVPADDSEAFGLGTYFHTSILEPHKVSKEIAVFEGKTRYGAKWELFKKTSVGKTVITESQKYTADEMVKVIKKSKSARKYLKGNPEISLFIKIIIVDGVLYAPHFGKKLTPDGWVKTSEKITDLDGFSIVLKVRSDTLGDTFISDLKSTSGRANLEYSVKGSIEKYVYDLSAALYLDLFSLINPKIKDFVWIFASKENPCVGVWVAHKDTIKIGRAKWTKAVKKIASLAENNWEIPDEVGIIKPPHYAYSWLEERDEDLL